MEMTYYLAVDIGASSGRHMLSHLEDGKLVLEEIYRFPNGMTEKNGHKVWDVERLFAEILNGMKQCARLGKIPHSMGIDTWAVDYVLLDGQGRRCRVFCRRSIKSSPPFSKFLLEKLVEIVNSSLPESLQRRIARSSCSRI